MPRDKLDKETAARVDKQLPDTSAVRRLALGLRPDFISACFAQGSAVPIATACLQDTTATLEEARYALFEALAHVVWNRGIRTPANETMAVFFGKFYADDAALRIYAAGEHLANAVENMLEIHKDVNDYKKRIRRKNIVSKQALVGSYLIDNDPTNEITKAILKLKESPDWKKTRKYRDAWVHGKPPIIKGLGIGYERTNRLNVWPDAIGISLGGGDEPHYSIDDLLDFMKPALFVLTETVNVVSQEYMKLVNDKGQKFFATV